MGKIKDVQQQMQKLVDDAALVLDTDARIHAAMIEFGLNVFTNWWQIDRGDPSKPFHVSKRVCPDVGCERCAQGETVAAAVDAWVAKHGEHFRGGGR